MRRVPVESASIASVGYDDATNVLEVEFTTGAVYCYYGVPRRLVEAVFSAESVGRAFNTLVRGHYPHQKVRSESRG